MMKAKILFFIFVFFVFSFFTPAAGMEDYLNKIEQELIEKINENPYDDYRVIVWFDKGYEIKDEEIIHEFDIIPAVAIKVDGFKILEYAKKDFVDKITLDKKVRLFRLDGMQTINYNFSKYYGVSGKEIKVAVIDTGVFNHTEFGNRIIKQKCFCSNYCCSNNSIESDNATDDHGHGTHVAGIIAGINGIASNASILAVKVLDSDGTGYDSDIVKGIDWAIENGANVISISFGLTYSEFGDCYKLGTSLAVDEASNFVVVVASVGNDGPGNGTIATPACVKNVVAVGSVSDSGLVSPFSSKGPTKDNRIKPDLVAPGEGVYSTYLNNQYHPFSGTSMSAPFVSGAAALVIEKYNKTFGYLPNPHLVKTILIHSANSIERNNDYGSGILDVEKALSSIENVINDSIKVGEKVFNSTYRTTLYWPENSTTHNNLDLIIEFNSTNSTFSSFNDTLIQFWMNDSYRVFIQANLSENQQFFLATFNLTLQNETGENLTNVTDSNYISSKFVPEIRLWINETEGNYSCYKSSMVNITTLTNDSIPITIYTNFSNNQSIFNSSSILINTSELDAATYNITASIEGNENYTENFVTYYLTISEQNVSDVTTTTTTTTTIVQYSGGGGEGSSEGYVHRTTTSTITSATTTTTVPTTTTIPKYKIHEEIIQEEKTNPPVKPTGFFVLGNSLKISLFFIMISLLAIILFKF